MNEQHWLCRDCGWHGPESELLSAPHPFLDMDVIYGCPRCKELDELRLQCDEPGCQAEATCGWPSEGGYRRTCDKHWPVDK